MTQKELELIQFAHIFNNPWVAVLIAILAIWTLTWKGLALWKAVKNNQTAWYVILLLVNTVGVLEIVYIFFFSKKEKE